MTARLRVILPEEILKLPLPSGIPQTVAELKQIVQETFAIEQDFTMLFLDQEFDGQFFTLLQTSDIKDKDTIKVVLAEPMITVEACLPAKGLQESFDSSGAEFSEDVCSNSTASSDTIILSSPNSTSSLRSVSWPVQFEIPTFSFDTELILQAANEAYRKDGTLLCNPAVKSNILEKLAESIFFYTAYPSQAQREQVAEALVTQHPYLRDPVSFNGLYGWHNSLKYKMGNYRAKVKHLGLPEIEVNSLKRKSAADRTPAKNLKKAKKCEVNYLPPPPQGETDETLEKERVELLYEYKKKDNNKLINEKMAKTFSLRRNDIILKKPPVIDFKARWPALFELSQIEEEFRRITLKPLLSTFLGKLDQYTPKLLRLYRRKGGAVGKKLDETLDKLNEDNSVESRREAAIRGLILYVGEKPEEFIKIYQIFDDDDAAAVQEEITTFVLNILMNSSSFESRLPSSQLSSHTDLESLGPLSSLTSDIHSHTDDVNHRPTHSDVIEAAPASNTAVAEAARPTKDQWNKRTCVLLVSELVRRVIEDSSEECSLDDVQTITQSLAQNLWEELQHCNIAAKTKSRTIIKIARAVYADLCRDKAMMREIMLINESVCWPMITHLLKKHVLAIKSNSRITRFFKALVKPFTACCTHVPED